MNPEEIERFEYELLPAQYKALLEINKYFETDQRIIILSSSKGSGKTFLLNFILKNVYNYDENNFIKHNNINEIPDSSIFTKLRGESLIIIDQGGFTREWFRELSIELQVNRIKTAIVSSNMSSSTELPVVRLELDKDDLEVFGNLYWNKTDKTIKENIDTQNLWDLIT